MRIDRTVLILFEISVILMMHRESMVAAPKIIAVSTTLPTGKRGILEATAIGSREAKKVPTKV